jgi:GGDEF domain-containing protein
MPEDTAENTAADSDLDREQKHYRSFILYTSIAVFLIILAIFAGVVVRTRQLVHDQVLEQARAHFNDILITREWSLSHGGVYVEKREGARTNPFITIPDETCKSGKVLVFIPPAVMTKEISLHAEEKGLFRYSIKSLNPINPENVPDDFERSALESFNTGKTESYKIESSQDGEIFRYMAPLSIDESCVACHARQGYDLGDIRGGISVDIEISHLQGSLKRSMAFILVAGAVSVAALLALIYTFTARLVRHVASSRRRIEELIITDDLTGIHNRRYLMARFEEEYQEARRRGFALSCVMVDLDHFKDFNDRFGHLVGDEILKDLSRFIKGMVRVYDIFGRFGGEEFMVVLPAADMAEARAFKVSVTISAGVAEIEPSDESMTDILRRADAAMYHAKQSGRNRVC